jgi:hypothetical protein
VPQAPRVGWHRLSGIAWDYADIAGIAVIVFVNRAIVFSQDQMRYY